MIPAKSLFVAAAVSALIYGVLSGAAQAVPIDIVNGDFEAQTFTGDFQTISAGSGFTGWTVTSGSIDGIHDYWQGADGSQQSIDLAGDEPGTISQRIDVSQTGDVSIDFSMAGNPDDPDRLKELEVSLVGNGQIFTFTVSDEATHQNMGWTPMEAVFGGVAAGYYTLTFADIDPLGNDSPYGAALDSISASVTPDGIVPASSRLPVPDGGMTAALLGAGLTGLAFLRRQLA